MRVTRLWSEQLLSRRLPFSLVSTTRQTAPILRTFFTSAPLAARPRPLLLFRSRKSLLSLRFRSLRFKSDKITTPPRHADPTPHLGSPEPAPSLSQRLRKLSRDYGWSALGVYLALTALDFPFCFLAVRWLGTERIGHYEHVVVEACLNVLRIPFPNLGRNPQGDETPSGVEAVEATVREGELGLTGQLDHAEAENQGEGASIWTQLALAYAIHKSFIFVRVPLTAAITPKVVKTLRKWGWNIGKRTPKPKSN